MEALRGFSYGPATEARGSNEPDPSGGRSSAAPATAPPSLIAQQAALGTDAQTLLHIKMIEAIGSLQRERSLHSVCPVFRAWPMKGGAGACCVMPCIGDFDVCETDVNMMWCRGKTQDLNIPERGANNIIDIIAFGHIGKRC